MGLIYFLGYLFLEIVFSYEFAKVFTPLGFFLEVLLSAGVGVYILNTLHLSLVEEMQRVMYREISSEEFLTTGLFRLIGAILLIIPGFFSDILGILFLFEPFATFVAKKFFVKKTFDTYERYEDTNKDNDIIDVEIIEEIPKK